MTDLRRTTHSQRRPEYAVETLDPSTFSLRELAAFVAGRLMAAKQWGSPGDSTWDHPAYRALTNDDLTDAERQILQDWVQQAYDIARQQSERDRRLSLLIPVEHPPRRIV